MRGLIVLSFTAIAFAAPQYNYQRGGEAGVGDYAAPSSAFHHAAQPAQIIYNKQFFIHSAPEDGLDAGSSNQFDNVSLKKNLRVVFIKSPENKGLENAALQLAKSASEDQTAIYVLNKQTDLSELQNKLSQIQDHTANKPEVHFVKYKTPQEAEHAQHSIQAQYDSFGGPTQVSNEGIAPLQSYIGSLGGPGSFGAGTAGHSATYLPPSFRH